MCPLSGRTCFGPRQQERSRARLSEPAVDHQPVHIPCAIAPGIGPHIAVHDQVPQSADHYARSVQANEPVARIDLRADIIDRHLADTPLRDPSSFEPQLAVTSDPIERSSVIPARRPNDRN